jgi:hypothetical protein
MHKFDKTKLAFIAAVLVLVIGMFTGCGGDKKANISNVLPGLAASSSASAGSTTNKATSSPSTKAPAQNVAKATSTPTPKKIPKLTDTTFTLNLPEGQEYVENPIPIYLFANQTLHLSWMVIKGGDHFHMTFTIPNGNLISISSSGSLRSYLHGESSTEKLTKNGDLVMQPGNNDWEDGYYIFHPQIQNGDASVTIKLLYWIE